MSRVRRFPPRFVRWTSLSVSLALIVVSLTTVPLQSTSSRGTNLVTQGRNGQSNGREKKVNPTPPVKGAPNARLLSLDELRQRQIIAPQAKSSVLSTTRSRRKPVESRNGRKDPLPPKNKASINERENGTKRASTGSTSAISLAGIGRLHHAPTTRLLSQAVMTGVTGLQLPGVPYSDVDFSRYPFLDFLRYPATSSLRWSSAQRLPKTETASAEWSSLVFRPSVLNSLEAFGITTVATVAPGAAITVSLTGDTSAVNTSYDWIGLYQVSADNTTFLAWRRVSLTGSVFTASFTAPTTPGQYEFRYLPMNGYFGHCENTVFQSVWTIILADL